MQSKITLTGLYNFDNTLFDELTFPAGIDRARPGFFYDWNAAMNRFGKTVYLCEAPGQSSGGGNFDEEIAGQYESAIFGSWLHGSAGAMPWALQCYPEEVWVEGYLDQYQNEQEFLQEFSSDEREITDVTDQIVLNYSYSGTQADGSSYGSSANAPVNATMAYTTELTKRVQGLVSEE